MAVVDPVRDKKEILLLRMFVIVGRKRCVGVHFKREIHCLVLNILDFSLGVFPNGIEQKL